ncbi:hypothetical protein R6Q59_026488 [Mikania micrantha]
MNHRGKISSFIFVAILVTCCHMVTTTARCSIYKTGWTVYITNTLNDAIVVHIKSTDHDLGNHTIPSNGVYSWTFCQKIIGSHFHGYFWWGSRYQNLALIDKELMILCRDDSEIADQFCYWMVVPDGFFVSGTNYTFPDNWTRNRQPEPEPDPVIPEPMGTNRSGFLDKLKQKPGKPEPVPPVPGQNPNQNQSKTGRNPKPKPGIDFVDQN